MKKVIYKILGIFKVKNYIILESFPTYTDNAKAFYDYLILHNYNMKYRIIWFCDNNCKVKLYDKNVRIVKVWKNVSKLTVIGFLKYIHYLKKAKYIIYCNRGIYKINSKSIRLFLNHGILFKKVSDLQMVSPNVDYTICPSQFFQKIYEEQLHLAKEKILVFGTPRVDMIKAYQKRNHKFSFINKNYKKIILWLPTFRSHHDKERIDSHYSFPLGIPIIYDTESLLKIDQILKKEDVFLLLKMHPAQDMSKVHNINLENIKLITDNDLLANNISLCEFLCYVDAIITDYSGIYYDALLSNKIIGFTIDDYEDYLKERGFVFDNPLEMMAGMKIKNKKDLITFIENLVNDVDKYKNEREKVCNLLFNINDGKSCERIIKFLKI